jgi:glutamine amidotransferase
MCRHLAWLGEPRTVASLVLEHEHGLLTQSYAPRRQRYGRINADGWGVGLLADDGPHRWRSTRPLWSDASFASMAPLLRASSVVAAVRCATTGMPIEEGATAPFTDGRWLLSHNGRVSRDVLPSDPAAESLCDSALLAAHIFAIGLEQLAAIVPDLGAKDPDSRLNVLASDGERILATTWGDTLSYLALPDGVVVASEPYDDDPGWVDVPDRHLLEVTHAGVTVTSLESEG